MEEIVVSTKQGTLKGTISSDLNGENFYSFQGIPYAVPPLNDAPQPLENWSGVLDATKEANRSYSRDPFLNTIVGTEDCLYVNVYTRKVPPNTNLAPVFFWVHGGAFIGGSENPDVYGPQFLLTENLVLVTVNYRLGILGFLSLETPELEVPGNAGLKDIVLALKWAQNNIRGFGGDPENVTVAGGSSGAALVHLLTLSPICEGLFHKVVLQSGCACNSWVYGTSGVEEIAKVLKMENKTEEVYYRLMKLPVEEILQIQEKIVNFRGMLELRQKSFSFVVEKFNSGFTFLNRHPFEILKSGSFKALPHLAGYCSDELMMLREYASSRLVPWNCCPHKNRISELVKRFYFGEALSKFSTDNIAQLYNDVNILGMYIFVANSVKHSQLLYIYKLTLSTELNCTKRLLNLNYPGAAHYDEISYLFKNFATPEVLPGSLEDLAIRRMVKLWGNFCKFGNPTPDSDPLLGVVWDTVRENEFKCLEIGEELAVGDIGGDFDRVKKFFKIMVMIQKERMYKAHF